MEGWQAWALIQQGHWQLRAAGMGSIIGLDIPACLEMAHELGYDRRLMAHLLPFAEVGLIAGIREQQEEDEE